MKILHILFNIWLIAVGIILFFACSVLMFLIVKEAFLYLRDNI